MREVGMYLIFISSTRPFQSITEFVIFSGTFYPCRILLEQVERHFTTWFSLCIHNSLHKQDSLRNECPYFLPLPFLFVPSFVHPCICFDVWRIMFMLFLEVSYFSTLVLRRIFTQFVSALK